jgi:hypothetical protein
MGETEREEEREREREREGVKLFVIFLIRALITTIRPRPS